jgi:hypothetical protein
VSYNRSSHNTSRKDDDAAALVPYNRKAEEKAGGTFRTGCAMMVQAARLQERNVLPVQPHSSYRTPETQRQYHAPQTQLSYRMPEPQPPYRGPQGQLPYLEIARFYQPNLSARAPQSSFPRIHEVPVSRNDRYQSTRESGRSSYEHTRQVVDRYQSTQEPERSLYEHIRQVARPRNVKTQIIRPSEPHHFGSRTDYVCGEVICTLCRCKDPDSHGDAYTMLDSHRGKDIRDWQEAKGRMLDFHKKDQNSHAEEVEVIYLLFTTKRRQVKRLRVSGS